MPDHPAEAPEVDLATIRAPVTPVARDLFLELLAQQEAKGIRKYGESLTTSNGRDGLRDALEELVDLFQYLVQVRLEAAAQAERLAQLDAQNDGIDLALIARHSRFASLRLRVEMLEAQRDAALRVVEAAKAWREAVHDLAQPMVPRQLELLAAVKEWEAAP